MDNNKLISVSSSVALKKTSTALSITDKLTFNQNRKVVKEIFLKNKRSFRAVIQASYSLNEDLLAVGKEVWNWMLLSWSKSLPWSENLVETFIVCWAWEWLSKNASLP